tara:strand:+ start:933 stop:1571 length:639 start_codon:yes stop_codon:yes gene_type:complete
MYKKWFRVIIIVSSIFISCEKKDNKKQSSDNNVIHKNIASGLYDINKTSSLLEWSGKKVAYGHNGTLKFKKGNIQVSSDGSISGKFEIDMNSINVTDIEGGRKTSLENHLKAEDFFGVDKFPIASITFQSNQSNIQNNQLDLNASLTIKNITHPIDFSAEIIGVDPFLKAKASLVFDRSLYDVRYGSGKFFDNLGDRLILDEVNVDVVLHFN